MLSTAADRHPELQALVAGKQFFDLRDELRHHAGDRSMELAFYRAVVATAFNQPRLAIRSFREFLTRTDASRDVRQAECHVMLAENYLRTFQYRRAAEAYGAALTRFRDTFDARAVRLLENSLTLWAALCDVPPQTARFDGNSTVQSSKNEAGTFVPGAVSGQPLPFLLDTGANLSVMTRSAAARLGLRLIEASVEVGAITGSQVVAQPAVAPAMKLGQVTIRHAIFLVLDDKDLYIEPIARQIDGIIGFPVISALREITFHRRGEITIRARPGSTSDRNLALDGLTLLIAGTFRGERMAFAIDTGARRSDLWPSFYRAHEHEIRSRYSPQADRIGGAGGFLEVTAYRLKDVVLGLAGKDVRLADVRVLTEPTLEKSRYLHGNLGRDVLDQFETMTLNFKTMSVAFA